MHQIFEEKVGDENVGEVAPIVSKSIIGIGLSGKQNEMEMHGTPFCRAVYPSSFFYLFNNIDGISTLNGIYITECISNHPKVTSYLCQPPSLCLFATILYLEIKQNKTLSKHLIFYLKKKKKESN